MQSHLSWYLVSIHTKVAPYEDDLTILFIFFISMDKWNDASAALERTTNAPIVVGRERHTFISIFVVVAFLEKRLAGAFSR